MKDNAQNDGPSSGRRQKPPRMVGIQIIRHGTPAHAEMIAQELGLSPPPAPAPPSESPLAPQPAGELMHTPPPSPERHERKCAICQHPQRLEIEELFLHWHNPWNIAAAYKVSARSLYRHSHATGLYAARQNGLRPALDRLLERAEDATVSGDCVIRAVRAYSCLGGDNRWTEPPTRVIFSSQALLSPAGAAAPIDVSPKRSRRAPSARRRVKSGPRKSPVLIDTAAIRTSSISLKTEPGPPV